ncbi:MAG: hypothetical protein AMXMBFR33_50550 [Candidatus Xenobia bacterium]
MQDVTPEDIEEVARLLATGVLSVPSGGILTRFEKRFAKFAGNRHAVAFCNGTASIYAALWACGVEAGDDVAVCDYGFHGMAAAVASLGARMVPVDCLEGSLTMDAADLLRARTPRMKAVLVHNPWGVPADWRSLRAACPDLPLISDASHAHGATYDGQPLGAQATVTCWSMGYQKLISGGELGAVSTDDPELADRMMLLGHPNRVPRELIGTSWQGNAVGLKLRPHPVALTLAMGQLKRFDQKLAWLRHACSLRERQVVEQTGLVPQAVPEGAERSYWRLVFHGGPREGWPGEPNHYWPPLQRQSLFDWPSRREQVLRRACPTLERVAPGLVTLPIPTP